MVAAAAVPAAAVVAVVVVVVVDGVAAVVVVVVVDEHGTPWPFCFHCSAPQRLSSQLHRYRSASRRLPLHQGSAAS